MGLGLGPYILLIAAHGCAFMSVANALATIKGVVNQLNPAKKAKATVALTSIETLLREDDLFCDNHRRPRRRQQDGAEAMKGAQWHRHRLIDSRL